jgi:hypothetical protein
LAALLGLYAALADREAEDGDRARRLSSRHARTALLQEHLLSWLPPYLDRLEALAPPAYRAWGTLLRSALREEAEVLGAPRALSAHLRAAPALPDPRREGSHAFVAGLLAPVRCGIILTRADLARAARDLNLGLRAGERKFAIAALLSQAPEAVLGWLAAEASRRAAQHNTHAGVMGPMAHFWAERAERAARMLHDLRDSAAKETVEGKGVEVIP